MDNTITIVLVGVISGIILASPPGVINLSILNQISSKQFKSAFFIGAGSALMDTLYALIVLFSTTKIYKILSNLANDYPKLFLVFDILLVVILAAYGFYKIFEKKNEIKNINFERYKKYFGKFHPFLIGCLLALTNLLFPTFIPSYAYMAALLLKSGLINGSYYLYFLFALAFGIGNLIWVGSIVGLSKKYEHIIDDNNYIRIQKGLGVLFILVSLMLVYKLYFYTNWQKIFEL